MPHNLIDTLALDKKEYEGLTKDDSIKKIMKNPKKMLFNIVISIIPDIKYSSSKILLAEKLYETL